MANSSKINIFLIVVLGILLYILFADKCTPTKTKPVVIKGKDVVKEINLVEQQRKHIEDSFNLIIQKAYQLNDDNYTAYIETININSELFRENKILRQKVPDTCRPLMLAWIERERQLKVASDNKDAAAKKTITGLQGTLWEQQRFLYAKDTSYAALKKIADTCAKALIKNENFIDKVEQKRHITVGVIAITPYELLKPAAGITLGYRSLKGTEIRVGYYTNKQISVGISTTLFKF